MNNMLYYCHFINLIKSKKILNKVINEKNNETLKYLKTIKEKKFQMIYSNEYTLYNYETIYYCYLNDNEFVLLYKDNINNPDILIEIYFILNDNKIKYELIKFGNGKKETVFNDCNLFLDELFKKSGAELFKHNRPKRYEEYIEFFNKILEDYWITRLVIIPECNLISEYLGIGF